MFYIHINKYWFGSIFPCLLLHHSLFLGWGAHFGFLVSAQDAAGKVIVNLLPLGCDNSFAVTGGGIPGRVWCRSCLSSVAEHPQKWGSNPSPAQLVKKDLLPSVLEFLNKFPPSHSALALGRNWVPWTRLQSPSFLLLHICPLNYSRLCFLVNASAKVLKPFLSHWPGQVLFPQKSLKCLPRVPLLCLAFHLWYIILCHLKIISFSLFIFSCLESWCVICNF